MRILLAMLLVIFCTTSVNSEYEIDICWYQGTGRAGSGWQSNIEDSFDELVISHGYTYHGLSDNITETNVINGDLLNGDGTPHYKVFYMMGGSGMEYYGGDGVGDGKGNDGLGVTGTQAIVDFVDAGGTFVGSCAGAFYGSDNYSDLWPGTAYPHQTLGNVYPDYTLSGDDINSGFDNPLESIMFYGGCDMETGVANTEYVATYDLPSESEIDGKVAMIVTTYGSENSAVVLNCGHPEAEIGTGEDEEYFKGMFTYAIDSIDTSTTTTVTISGLTVTGVSIQ